MIILFALLLVGIHCVAALTLINDTSNSTSNHSQTRSFTVTVLDHNNNDVTSSFQILLYSQSRQNDTPPSASPPNSTSFPLHRRAVVERPIVDCIYGQQFLSSHCNPIDDTPGTLQAYTITCRHGPSDGPPTPSGRNTITQRQGSCEYYEICVDGTSEITEPNPRNRVPGSRQRNFLVHTAICVSDSAFEPVGPDWDTDSVAGFWAAATGLNGGAPSRVRAALSRYDRSTPIEADRLAIIEEGSTGSSGGGVRQKQQAVCRDCLGLGIEIDRGGVEGLKVEARLLTTVQAGAAGVLWLAAMSG